MQNIIKKTNLGIAVAEAINQLSLQRQRVKIMGCLQRSFQQKFDEFKKGFTNSNSLILKGSYVADNQFPIGQNDKQQYFKSVAYNCKLGSLLLHSRQQKRPFILIEGYSKNDDKKRNHAKGAKNDKKVQKNQKPKKQKNKPIKKERVGLLKYD